MRRIIVACFLLTVAAVGLGACGDTGDHFLEFRQNPSGTASPSQSTSPTSSSSPSPGSATVASIGLSMISTPNPSTDGIYSLTLTAKTSSGRPIANGQSLANPIQITSNASCVTTFAKGSSAAFASSLTLSTFVSPVLMSYQPSNATASCAPSKIVVTAAANGATHGTLTFGGPSSKPTPTASPTPTGTVGRVVLSMPSTPNPVSPGTFPLVVKIFNAKGQTIPTGELLSSPLVLSTNSSCTIAFQTTTGTQPSATLTSAPGSVTVVYTAPAGSCTPPSEITIAAFDLTGTPQTSTLSVLGGSATVKTFSLSMLATPNPKSAGVYPFFITAKTTGNKTVPYGQTLANPVQLSTNASCVTTFGKSPDAAGTTTYTYTNTTTQIYLFFNPGDATAACPAPKEVIVTAISLGAPTRKFKFIDGLPTP